MLGAITPLPQYVFMAWCSVKKKKHRDNFLPYLVGEPEGSSLLIDSSLLETIWNQSYLSP
jgi:hypothetical protein